MPGHAPAARRRVSLRLVTTSLAALAALTGAASGERLPVTYHSAANGLPHNRVKSIVRDSRGFLWFGTAGGLSRFDGERFVTYGVAHGLSHPSINHIVEARDGTYWLATNGGGICHFTPNAATRELIACRAVGDGLANRVNALLEDRRGWLWAATDAGLFRLDPSQAANRFVPLSSGESRGNAWALATDATGDVWAGLNRGLARIGVDGIVRTYAIDPARPSRVWGVLADRHGRLWIGHDHGVVVLRPLPVTEASGATPWRTLLRPSARNEATPGALPLPTQPGEALALTPAEGLVVQRPGSFIETSAGHIWIGSAVWAPGAPGLIEFDGRTLRAYSAEHGLSDDPVIAIAEDRDRNLWLGTDAGAIRLARIGLTAYGQRDGLAPGVVEAIVAGRQGDIYALTRGLLIHRFDGTRFVGVRPNVGSAEWSGGSQAPLIDRLGEWWIPTHQGLYRFSPPRRLEDLAHARPSAIYGAADGVPSGPILGPSEDDRGDLWFGVSGHDAAVRWERATGRFHVYGERDGLAGAGAAVAFRNDRAGNLWIGFQRGAVARLRGGRFLMFRSADGVPSGTIATLHLDRSGRLWVGSRDAGIAYMTPAELSASGSGRRSRPAELARVDEPAAEQPRIVLYAPDVLAGFGVSDIAEDRQGQLHIAGDQGVQRLDPATGRINRYTVADGLPSEDVQNALADAEGRLWFGTRRGVARLVLSSNEPAPPTPVSIGQLRIRGIPHPIAELGQTDVSGLELEADQNQIEIDFFALAFAAGRPPLYQYRLDGADTDWGPPSEQRRVTYVALSPGQYRFLVRAVTADGTASKPATVAFVILRPLWQRPWFVALALAALMLAVYSIHRARVARLLAVERMRTRIATDLHDDIGSSLSQIAILSEVIQQRHPDSVELAHPLARIAATSRELVDSMSDIVWAINPQRDSLLDLVQRMRRFANDVLGARGIAFTFQAPATDDHLRLGVDVRRHVFLIFKEAVNNVARHSSSTHAAIALSCLDGTLMLSVEDNGLGFQAAVKPQGHGLASMRSRAAAIDGTVTIAAAPDGGTHVRLEVPLRARGWPFGR